jgi:CheY-like chemotaxis protein
MTERRIVLVDDEEALAWSLSSRLARAYPNYRIETANDGGTALALLREAAVDLLIADIRMPGMNGIDLVLAARNLQPELPVIVMTAFKSVDITSIHSGPYTGFLEKPFEFDLLRDSVDQALSVKPERGFSGAISVQTLPDIVQLYVLSSATGALIVRNKATEGRIYFSNGSILHAHTPSFMGDEAFYEIMMWSTGEFSMRAGSITPERSVDSNWQELLMESVRRLDEKRRSESQPEQRNTGWTHRPPAQSRSDDDLLADSFFDFEPDRITEIPVAARIPDINEGTRELPMNIKDSLSKLNQIDGFVGAALVDSESGMLLGQEGGGSLNLEVAAAGNTEVVRAKRKTMSNLALKDGIEDILITLSRQYHLIRPLRARTTLFFYVALDRQRANLAMARIALADVEKELQV